MKKFLSIFAAFSLSIILTGCAEKGEKEAQSKAPNAYVKETFSYSGKKESKPEESPAVAINSDVMWGIGKTVDEVTEKYGSAAATGPEGLNNIFKFENGYGTYIFFDGCENINGISAKDFLVGDLSTVTLDNIAEKCGFNVIPPDPEPDSQTLFDGRKFAYYIHPDYKNVTFSMVYKESGFDETASFTVRFFSDAATDDLILTLNSVIYTAADVEALNSGIKNADVDALISEVRVFEHPLAFENNTLYTDGVLTNGAVVLVEFSDGSCYIAVRGERTTEPLTEMDMHRIIVDRADTVEQLKAELAGYARGGRDKAIGSITLYQDRGAAYAGDDSGEAIIQNGNLVAGDDTLKKGGTIRVEYDDEEGWFIMPMDVDNV